ncbi:hypothetical protein [Paenibacillus sp. R14(2021)]|uniref:hypothetical protein n=1 Tax=Paenibacillus sp. R14(2021) TaxID=2859228 RepID=UPI001C614F5E|nr:hypothetical protein [Paenibacillus sp. R14(2021)]
MDYKPAQLDGAALAQLQQFESELRKQTSEEIIVIAYQASGDASQSGINAAHRE